MFLPLFTKSGVDRKGKRKIFPGLNKLFQFFFLWVHCLVRRVWLSYLFLLGCSSFLCSYLRSPSLAFKKRAKESEWVEWNTGQERAKGHLSVGHFARHVLILVSKPSTFIKGLTRLHADTHARWFSFHRYSSTLPFPSWGLAGHVTRPLEGHECIFSCHR